MKALRWSISYLLMLVLFSYCSPIGNARTERRIADRKTIIPALGHLVGMKIGFSSIEDIERMLGPGRVMLGGHPNGGREWSVRGSDFYIWADGFDYSDRGRVINQITVGQNPSVNTYNADPLTRVPLSQSHLSLLGRIRLGMTPDQVLQATRGRLAPPQRTANRCPELPGFTWEWSQAGYVKTRKDGGLTYGMWSATLYFEKRRLHDITVDVD